MRCQWVRRATFALASVVLLGGAVAAHHSQPGFSPNTKPIDLKGTVAEYRWRNPHVLFFFDVKDDKGTSVRWVGEFGSVPSSIARGMTKDTFKVGEDVTVNGVPATAGTPAIQLRRIVKADGTVIGGATE
jgi:hypothetical protein